MLIIKESVIIKESCYESVRDCLNIMFIEKSPNKAVFVCTAGLLPVTGVLYGPGAAEHHDQPGTAERL